MGAKQIRFEPELRQILADGSAAVTGTVASNFGPEGRNTICDQKYDVPLIANTGRRILKDMELEDAARNLSATLIRDAALKVADTCGDGSIATTLLTNALLQSGNRLIAAGYNPMVLRRGLQRGMLAAVEMLPEIALPFSAVSMERFAKSAAKNDEVAENSRKAFEAVGQDGSLSIQDTQFRETTLNIWDGARYEYGLLNNSFMTDTAGRRAVLEHPHVLLSNVKIESLQDIRRMLEEALRTKSPLLIITNDITEEVQRALLVNRERAGLRVVVAKAPGFGDTRRRNMFALAAKTGSLMFDTNTGRKLSDCGLEACARVARAEVTQDATILQGFEHSSEEVTDVLRQHTLRQLDKTADPDEREKLQETLAVLNGKTAEILVGGVTEYEMFEKKYLYENTIRTLQNAARSGVVPGAGSAYVHIARKLRSLCADWPEAERLGAVCLSDALCALAKAHAENAGEDGAVVLAKLVEADDPWQGYDVVGHTMTDLRQAGILMPRSTVEAILATAAETAGSLLTTSVAVLETK